MSCSMLQSLSLCRPVLMNCEYEQKTEEVVTELTPILWQHHCSDGRALDFLE
jgi:hypothetical protein